MNENEQIHDKKNKFIEKSCQQSHKQAAEDLNETNRSVAETAINQIFVYEWFLCL